MAADHGVVSVAYDPDNGKYLAVALSTGAVQVMQRAVKETPAASSKHDLQASLVPSSALRNASSAENLCLCPGLGSDRRQPQQTHECKEPCPKGE
jgi:hypothetical protein